MNSDDKTLEWGRKTLMIESRSLAEASERLGSSFIRAVRLIEKTGGKVVVTGLGKSGHVGAKIASTLSSTGTPSFFLHSSEALHGDFGMIGPDDVLLAIAYGGETREVLAVCKYARERSVPVVGITGFLNSGLAGLCDIVLDAHVREEADALGLAPTASSTVTLAIGDALAAALMYERGFSREHFAALHPGGKLGRSLRRVESVMKGMSELPLVGPEADFHSVLEAVTCPNFGIVGVVEEGKKLLGCITDGDVRRALLEFGSDALSKRAEGLMSASPRVVSADDLVVDAVALMEAAQITSLFVTSARGEVRGLIRLHDLLSEKLL